MNQIKGERSERPAIVRQLQRSLALRSDEANDVGADARV